MAGIMPKSEEDKLRGYLKTLGEHYMMLGSVVVWFMAGYGLYSVYELCEEARRSKENSEDTTDSDEEDVEKNV
jgi:hypothetical protein